MKASRMVGMAGVFLAVSTFNVQAAGISIQSAQFKEQKNELFVKGKAGGLDQVYVVYMNNPSLAISSIRVKSNGDFNADLSVNPRVGVPCGIRIQENPPGRGGGGVDRLGRALPGSDPGVSGVSMVRHAPEDCR